MKMRNFATSFINSGKMEHIIPIASDHGGFEMKQN